MAEQIIHSSKASFVLENGATDETGTLRNAFHFTIQRESEDILCTLKYVCGSMTGTVLSEFSDSELNWLLPDNLASQNTNGTILSVEFQLYYHSEDSTVKSATYYTTLNIPESFGPTISVNIHDQSENYETYGFFIQGQSKPYTDIAVNTKYGATLSEVKLKTQNSNHYSSGQQFNKSENNQDGYLFECQHSYQNGAAIYLGYPTFDFEYKVTDSRGFSTTFTADVPSYSLNPPVVSELMVQRCNADGSFNSSGSYLCATWGASVSSLGGTNAAEYTFQYRKSSVSQYTDIDMSSLIGQYEIVNKKTVFPAEQTSSYEVKITVQDSYTSTTKTSVGQSIKKLWSWLKNGLGFGIGKIAERQNTLDMGFDIHMNSTNRIRGLPKPENDDEPTPKGYVDSAINEIKLGNDLKFMRSPEYFLDYYYREAYNSFTHETEKEWFNPPMFTNVEYRTTETWQGLAVYCKYIESTITTNLPTFADETRVVIPHNCNIQHLVRVHGQMTNYPLPYYYSNGYSSSYTGIEYVGKNELDVRVVARTYNDAPIKIWLYYTKIYG